MATSKSAGSEKTGRSRIWRSIISAVAVIIAAGVPIGMGWLHGPKSSEPPPPIIFSGTVRDDAGKPISQASVIIAEDQSVPQVVRTDADGIFHVQIPDEIRSLRLTVNAEGFGALTKDVNIHRTGPEEIYMQRLASVKPELNKGQDAQNHNGNLSTTGSHSPIITGNGNIVK